jgi:hypothetical protein
MSSDGDDDPHSPSAFLEAPSSQSVIVDTKPFASQIGFHGNNADEPDQESSEEERENRFTGPASTWRDYTADERGLIASLDQERAGDLSVHLYNAHALKSHLYDRHAAATSQPWHSKHHWIKPNEDGSTPWYPDANWTAWPLHADDVPRNPEGFGKDVLLDDAAEGVFKMPVAWRAGADLEDEVQALMQRRAKDRFMLRSRAQSDPPTRQPSTTRSPSHVSSSPPAGPTSRRSSVASGNHSHGSDSDVESTKSEKSIKPDFMMDDDDTRRLLSQGSRHVLSEFDKLLMGLHTSRQYHTFGSASDTTPGAKPRPQKRKRRSTTNETPVPLAKHGSAESEDGQEQTSSRDYKQHPSGSNALYPRDWSEVLGIASVTGWNPAVVDRAAKRCAALFGERMLFRTMPETATGKAADRVTEYVPEIIPDFDFVDNESEMEAAEEPEHETEVAVEDGFRCPEESCPQHDRLYEKRYMIRQHLRRAHKYDQKALDAYDQTHALPDAKPSIEQVETNERMNDDRISEEDDANGRHEFMAAVATDGYMEPVTVPLGRGTDIRDRKRRGEVKRLGAE